MLAAFAVMGSCYVNKVEGRKDPSVALANNGAEESKGTPMLREAHQLLKTTPGIRFVGNIEPRDVPNGEVDVVVCDGFTGNVILKLTEGVAKMLPVSYTHLGQAAGSGGTYDVHSADPETQ